jgi:flagellin-like hook-associated protein FlgL
MNTSKISLALASMLLVSSASFGDDKADIQMLKEEIKQLKETTQSLIDETSDLKTGFSYTTVDTKESHSGLGAAASKVYYSKSPLSIGGYGEMYYSNTDSDDNNADSSKTEVKRLITYLGYKFTDNIILNTEIEYEGGGVTASGGGDEVVVEFMYLDFLINKNFNVRLGNFLMPVGLINQRHEPTLFTTVQRPQTSKYLIPTTWNESGAMLYGEITDTITYKLAGVSALQPDDTAGAKWLRAGRGGSFAVTNPGFAGVGRIDYTDKRFTHWCISLCRQYTNNV